MNKDVLCFCLTVIGTLLGATANAAGRFEIGLGAGVSMVDGVTKTDPTVVTIPQIPQSVSLDGLQFDDEDTAGKVFVRYEFAPRAGVELGYWNLGRFNRTGPEFQTRASLQMSQWTASGYYRVPLSRSISFQGRLGVARAHFEGSGASYSLSLGNSAPILINSSVVPRLVVPVAVGLFPSVYVTAVTPIYIPIGSPTSETGLTWGIGFRWKTTERLGLEFAYDQHRIKVQNVESLAVSLTYSL